MAFNLGKMVEGPSYAILNEILGEFRTNDGFARPSRYEILLLPPTGARGTASDGGDVTKPYIHSIYDAYQDAVDAAYDLQHDEGIHGQIVELD